jgi:hypothetical protein
MVQVPRGHPPAHGCVTTVNQIGLEPACLETADEAPRDLASRSTTSEPDNESWDFEGNEQDFGEERNPPKPHASP